MAVLYQKYRPQNFSEIFGQNHIKVTLQNEITSNKIAHAYLFCGPRAVGKTTLARVFSKAINCREKKDSEFEPCNKCLTCQSINNFSNMDVIEIDAASNTGVDNVRENIISISKISSSNNKFKVFIIDEVHMLSISAFNALLKTLEEPPANVIFILCTTEIYKVPLTIISRCERFDFKKISVADMIMKLETIVKNEKIDISRDVLELISLKADGHLRDAESILSQIIAISGNKIDMSTAKLIIPHNNIEESLSLLESLSRKDMISSIKMINSLMTNNINLKNFINDFVELLRKMILNKINDSLASSLGLDLSEKLEIKISELNKNFSLDDLIKISEEFILASKELKFALITQMPLELAIINLCQSRTNNYYVKNNELSENIINNSKIMEDGNNKINEEEVVDKNNLEKIITSDIFPGFDEKWSEFLTKLKPINNSLSFVMQSCKVSDFNNNKICLSFKYKFHKDRIEDPVIKKTMEDLLKDIYKMDLKIESIIESQASTIKESEKIDNNAIDTLLKTFGGQIIN